MYLFGKFPKPGNWEALDCIGPLYHKRTKTSGNITTEKEGVKAAILFLISNVPLSFMYLCPTDARSQFFLCEAG
jgi:hypothetical protein